jgi:hypothetical protein
LHVKQLEKSFRFNSPTQSREKQAGGYRMALLEASGDADIRSLIEMMTLMEDLKSQTSSIEEQAAEEAEIKMIRQEIAMLVSMGNVQHPAWDSARARSKVSLPSHRQGVHVDTRLDQENEPTQGVTESPNAEHKHEHLADGRAMPVFWHAHSKYFDRMLLG